MTRLAPAWFSSAAPELRLDEDDRLVCVMDHHAGIGLDDLGLVGEAALVEIPLDHMRGHRHRRAHAQSMDTGRIRRASTLRPRTRICRGLSTPSRDRDSEGLVPRAGSRSASAVEAVAEPVEQVGVRIPGPLEI